MASSSPRRIGATDSATRGQLVDAAEALLLEEGYAAVTSRRVAARAGLKPQLVHYYFRTMDDLFIEVFRRRADENLRRLQDLVAGTPTLRDLWAFSFDPRGATFMIELVAASHHRPAVRAEIAGYAERTRALQLAAISDALAAAGVSDAQIPPVAALLLMTGLTQILGFEQVLGVTAGHDDTLAFIESAITALDAPR